MPVKALLSLARVIGGLPLALIAINMNIDVLLSRCLSFAQALSGGGGFLTISMFIILTAILPTTALAIFCYCLGRYITRSRQNRRVARTLANFCREQNTRNVRVNANGVRLPDALPSGPAPFPPGLRKKSHEEELEEMRYY